MAKIEISFVNARSRFKNAEEYNHFKTLPKEYINTGFVNTLLFIENCSSGKPRELIIGRVTPHAVLSLVHV